MSKSLSAKPSEHGSSVTAALDALYTFDYGSDLEELRTLYAKGLDLQWIGMRELPWDQGVDQTELSRSFSLGGIPIDETTFWTTLPEATRYQVARRGTALMLSNFLHGEQGALMVASQLVNAVPHLDGKLYAASQTLDEARHVEVFAKYIETVDHIYPITPALKSLLDKTLQSGNWMFKCVGMQIVVEGLALYVFRDMRDTTREPLLKKLLTYVSQDEARHTAYGIKYLSAVLPSLSAAEIAELEDFAFEASRMLIDSRSGASLGDAFLQIWRECGIDPVDVGNALSKDREKLDAAIARRGGRIGPVSGFVVPTLKRIGLLSDRASGHFRQLFDALQISVRADDGTRRNPLDGLIELPDDLDAWARP
jgi:P-aminobenzoate N-oxygenase AurF